MTLAHFNLFFFARLFIFLSLISPTTAASHLSSNPTSKFHADFQVQMQSSCLVILTSALNDPHFPVRREGEKKNENKNDYELF